MYATFEHAIVKEPKSGQWCDLETRIHGVGSGEWLGNEIPTISLRAAAIAGRPAGGTILCAGNAIPYRKELTKVFNKYHKKVDTDWLKTRPRHGDWNICLVSLGKPALKLPFFARCSLVKVYSDLREQGHDVSFLTV